jgi:nicotinamidase-related amidase
MHEPQFENIEIHWKHSALLIIDMQMDFATPAGKSYIEGTSDVVPNIAELARLFRANRLPVVHIVRIYLEDGSNAELCRRQLINQNGPIVAPQSEGAKIVPDLLPENPKNYSDHSLLNGDVIQISASDFVMHKPRWGAFYNTALDEWLRKKHIDSLLIAGCNFPNCPRTTIYEASERDYRLGITEEAISQMYPRGIEELKRIGVNVYSLSFLKQALSIRTVSL